MRLSFAEMELKELNIHNFLPTDSLFRVTASLSAEGRGFDIFSPNTRMNIKAGVSNFEYAGYSFSGIDMKAGLANGKTNVAFNINDNMMEIGSILDADISRNNIMAKCVQTQTSGFA